MKTVQVAQVSAISDLQVVFTKPESRLQLT